MRKLYKRQKLLIEDSHMNPDLYAGPAFNKKNTWNTY